MVIEEVAVAEDMVIEIVEVVVEEDFVVDVVAEEVAAEVEMVVLNVVKVVIIQENVHKVLTYLNNLNKS